MCLLLSLICALSAAVYTAIMLYIPTDRIICLQNETRTLKFHNSCYFSTLASVDGSPPPATFILTELKHLLAVL